MTRARAGAGRRRAGSSDGPGETTAIFQLKLARLEFVGRTVADSRRGRRRIRG